MTSDIKLDCQIELVNNLKRYGDENKKINYIGMLKKIMKRL